MSTSDFHFDHRLSPKFLDALEELTQADNPRGRWWRDILVHPDLILAIRKDSLNFYYRGQSIFLVAWDKSQVVPKTHFKYLVQQKQALVKLDEKNAFDPNPEKFMSGHYDGRNILSDMIKAATAYAGPEKSGLHALIKKATPKTPVIDVEAAFRRIPNTVATQIKANDIDDDNDDKSLNPSAKKELELKWNRIDVVTLERQRDMLHIVFHEAKHFANKELRSSAIKEQIDRYRETISDYEKQITENYRDVCRALVRLSNMKNAAHWMSRSSQTDPMSSPEALKLIAEAGNETASLKVDREPRLIVFGFDQDQKDGAWKELKQKLGPRVKAIGNPRIGGASVFSP